MAAAKKKSAAKKASPRKSPAKKSTKKSAEPRAAAKKSAKKAVPSPKPSAVEIAPKEAAPAPVPAAGAPVSAIDRIEAAVDRSVKWGMAVAFSTAALLYLVQVSLRFITHKAILWIDPLIQYLFVMSALFGAAYAVKFNENLKIELFRRLAARRWVQTVLNVSAALLTGALWFLFFERFREELGRTEKSDFGVARWILEIPYLILFALMCFYFLRNAFRGGPALDESTGGHP